MGARDEIPRKRLATVAAAAIACAILSIGEPRGSVAAPTSAPSPASDSTPFAADAAAIAAQIRRGIAEAPTDFINVRGHQNAFWNWDATVSFGPTFDHCSVVHDTDTGNWGLQCTSTDRMTSLTDLRATVERAVAASIPPGFKFARAKSDSEPDMEWTGPGVAVWVFVTNRDKTQTFYSITVDHLK